MEEKGLKDTFTSDHRHCDELWGAFEAAVDEDPEQAASAFARFDEETRQHLRLEEEILFPEFEAVTGMTQGPTKMMTIEHERMRLMLGDMKSAIAAGDLERALDQGDTLLLFTQQHNQKEEAMLYPMAQNALASCWPQLAEKVKNARA